MDFLTCRAPAHHSSDRSRPSTNSFCLLQVRRPADAVHELSSCCDCQIICDLQPHRIRHNTPQIQVTHTHTHTSSRSRVQTQTLEPFPTALINHLKVFISSSGIELDFRESPNVACCPSFAQICLKHGSNIRSSCLCLTCSRSQGTIIRKVRRH